MARHWSDYVQEDPMNVSELKACLHASPCILTEVYEGWTLFHFLALSETLDVSLLSSFLQTSSSSQPAPEHVQDEKGNTFLHILCANTVLDLSLFIKSLSKRDWSLANSCGQTPLHVYCKNTMLNAKALQSLVDCSSIDVMKCDENGDTALHILSENDAGMTSTTLQSMTKHVGNLNLKNQVSQKEV